MSIRMKDIQMIVQRNNMDEFSLKQRKIYDLLDELDRDELFEIIEEAKDMYARKDLTYLEWGKWE